MKGICILGSTGSIGVSTLDVLRLNHKDFNVLALTAHQNIERLFQQCLEFNPQYAVVSDELLAEQLAEKLRQSTADGTTVLSGEASLCEVAKLGDVDIVVAAIVGAAGLLPCLSAAEAGKRILLANKEALVVSGDLFMDAVKQSGGELLPLDSEHNALFQCMPAGYQTGVRPEGVRKIILTASGGPFLHMDVNELVNVTPQQACAHPNWSMGKKISVDSATMLNKGLEVIEASYLFAMPAEHIDVVIHPQSVIHSLVDYQDSSVLAQLGNPDMKTPIAHALAWPERINSGVPPLDFVKYGQLTFSEPDTVRFPCLQLAFDALKTGGTAPAILNAANEVAVDAFLQGHIKFTSIAKVIENVLGLMTVSPADSIADVLDVDQHAREVSISQLGVV
ncbi:MAG: 1-deoxy-D-xylulose-5-phosphate reductoisomerase [Piscirickettsiaceae bacterium]|nr:MAG: 1-deoxy-D-xylulose-5-phosphate reductoisomerase [Piscirickettsiaceae bacterium]